MAVEFRTIVILTPKIETNVHAHITEFCSTVHFQSFGAREQTAS